MKNKTFKPQLAPNEQPNLDELNYPLLSSTKLDGCRLLIKTGTITTRSLKPLKNKQLNDKFEPIRVCTDNKNILLDGEIYAEGIPFYMISSCFMTEDYNTKKSVKRWADLCETYEIDITREEVLEKLKFYVFDYVEAEYYRLRFAFRTDNAYDIAKKFPNLIVPVIQILVHSADEVRTMFKDALEQGYEGLILKDPNGRYKCGRGTLKEGLIFKCKPYVTIDAQIIGVKQATKVNPNAPKTINELGRSVTSKKQEDRILIPRAKTFTVYYEQTCSHCKGSKIETITTVMDAVDFESKIEQTCAYCLGKGVILHEVDVAIGGTEAERDEIWANKESYIGRWIEYKGLLVGSKDVPRHCNMMRWREDKDE